MMNPSSRQENPIPLVVRPTEPPKPKSVKISPLWSCINNYIRALKVPFVRQRSQDAHRDMQMYSPDPNDDPLFGRTPSPYFEVLDGDTPYDPFPMLVVRNPNNSEERDGRRFTRNQWVTLILMELAHLLFAMQVSIQDPLFPAESLKRNVTTTEYALPFAMFHLAVVLTYPLAAYFITSQGANGAISVGMLAVGAASVFFGMVHAVQENFDFITTAVIIRFVEGVGTSTFSAAGFIAVYNQFPNAMDVPYVSFDNLNGLGLLVGPVCGLLLNEVGGFRVPFITLGVCIAVLGFFALLSLPRIEPGVGDRPCRVELEAQVHEVLFCLHCQKSCKDVDVILAILSIILVSVSGGFLNVALFPHLKQFGLGAIPLGAMFMINGGIHSIVSSVISSFVNKLPSKCGPTVIILFGSALCALGFLFLGPAPFIQVQKSLSIIGISLAIHGIGISAVLIAAYIILINRLMPTTGTRSSNDLGTYRFMNCIWTVSFHLGLFVGTLVGGIMLEDHNDIRSASVFPFICSASVTILTFAYIIIRRCLRICDPSPTPIEELEPLIPASSRNPSPVAGPSSILQAGWSDPKADQMREFTRDNLVLYGTATTTN